MSTGSLPGVKRPGHGVDHPPPSSTKVKETVELYLYYPSGPSWPVLGLTLPLLHLHWERLKHMQHSLPDHQALLICTSFYPILSESTLLSIIWQEQQIRKWKLQGECHVLIWGIILVSSWQDRGTPQPVPELNSEPTLSWILTTVPTTQLPPSMTIKWSNCPTSLKCSLYCELPNPNTANFMPLSNSFSTLKSLEASSSHLQNQAAVSGGLPSVYVGNMNTQRLFPDVWKY